MPPISVIIPTYREAGNLGELVRRVSAVASAQGLDLEVVVVDDDSPDDTVSVVEALRRAGHRVRLVVRRGERGLATAVLRGLDEAAGELLIVMDADLSHPPERIPDLVRPLQDPNVDLVLGSRFAPGGSVCRRWGLFRRLNSLAASLLARPLTRVADPMAGFFALRRDTYLRCRGALDPVGFKIALEVIVKAPCRNVVEVPIAFEDRRAGDSKMDLRQQANYLRHLAGLYLFRLTRPAEGAFACTPARAAVLLAAAFACGLLFTLARRDPGELPVYVRAAQRYLHGESFYRPEEGKGFTYPPFFVLPFVPFALLPPLAARVAWNVTNFTLAGAFIWLVARRLGSVLGPAARRPLVAAVLTALLLLLSPLEYQGHDYVVLLLSLAAVLLWDGRGAGCGACAGLAAACKATPLLFLPALLVGRRYRAALVMGVVVAAASLLPDLFIRAGDGEPAVATWRRTFLSGVGAGAPAQVDGGAWVPWNLQNQSLSGTVYRLTTPSERSWVLLGRDIAFVPLSAGWGRLVTLSLQLGVAGLLLWVCYRFPRAPYLQRPLDRLGLGGLVMAAMVLLSPMSNTPHFAALFVLVAYLAASARRSRAVALCAVPLLGLLTAKDLVGDPVKQLAMGCGAHTAVALACFVTSAGVMLRQFRLVREAKTPSGPAPLAATADGAWTRPAVARARPRTSLQEKSSEPQSVHSGR